MDNYEVLEVIHASRTSETIILKVKEKNKRICDKVYALKLIGSLNNRFQKLIFKREVDALKTLNSCDNIVKIRDYMLNAEFRGKNDWGLILLDYVDGTNLEELDLSNFSQVEKYELCLKILKAIEEAHNYNVLHRDIKPSNIMYNIETGEVKIIDFGTSKIKSIVEQETTLPFYSPNFSAPEVVKGNSTTEASDIYSLGAVIFYILFGMLPNGTEMICRTLQDLEVPENLGILIAKMVAEEPENRFQEVGTVIDAFEEIIGDNSSQKDTYLCSIDVDKLRYLKNVSLIEANTNMTIFTKSFLKSQFKECSAFYNHNTDVYIFSGKKIAVECIYNEKDELFVVNRIMPLSVDRRISNQKRGFIIDGIVKFIESGRGNYSSRRLDNDNEKLIVQFRNNINSKSALQKQDDTSRILVVSQSHTAVDNIIEGLVDIDEGKLDIIRIGRAENISPKVEETCTMNAIRKKMFTEIKEKSNTYIEHQNLLYANITEQKSLDRWERIKDIQADWINRCSNLETLDYQVIKSATIIAGTCVGFLSNDFVKELDFDYVIIDEAAKATTPELLVSIIKSKKIILVGDQNQLPAYADQELSPIIAKLTKEPKYRLFDLLFNVLPDTHKQILTVQYRMRRNIGNLISQVFYEGKIATEVDDKNRMHPIKKFAGKSIIWIDTSMMDRKDESRLKGGSYCNYAENTLVKKLLEGFKNEGVLPNLDIGIITGYRGQKDLIRKSVNNSGYDRIAKGIDINTLDAFQGRENDIIIYSTVRTKNSIGFQKEKERVNVAFSRAKNLLIICGDMDFFYKFDDPDNKFIEIIDYICEHEDECLVIPGGEI